MTGAEGRALLRVLGLLLIAAFVLEGGVRLRQFLKHGTVGKTVFAREVDAETGLVLPVPNSTVGGIVIDEHGFRSPPLETPKPEGRVRMAFLGGSTTFCADVTDNTATWPHLVAAAVDAAFEDVDVDYVNAAGPGFSSKHSITNLEKRVAKHDPDVIVIYHGTNDLNLDSIEVAEERGIFSGRAEEPSWLADVSLAWYLVEKNRRVKERQSRAGKERLDVAASEYSDRFAARLDTLIESAKETADVVAICTFSKKARRDQPADVALANFNTSLYYMPYMDAESLFDGFDEYNRVVREAAARHGVLLIETDGAIPGDDEHFVDSVHFSDAGAARMAERVSESLLASPELGAILSK